MPSFPTLLAIPANVTLAFKQSTQTGQINGVELDFAPSKASGGKFDLSNTTAYTMRMDNGIQPSEPAAVNVPVTVSLLTATASGGSLAITPTDLATAFSAVQVHTGNTNGKITIIASDGTNTIIVATGTWNMSTTA